MTSTAEKEADEKIAVAMEFADCKLSLNELVDYAWLQVHRRLGSQRARLLAGFIEQPDADEIQHAAMGMCLVRFLENCRDRPNEAAAWLRRRADG